MTSCDSRRGSRGVHLRRLARDAGDVPVDQLERVFGAKRRRAGQQLVQQHAERVQVAACVDRARHAAGLLGRDVGQVRGHAGGGAARRPAPATRSRLAEVDQPGTPAGRVRRARPRGAGRCARRHAGAARPASARSAMPSVSAAASGRRPAASRRRTAARRPGPRITSKAGDGRSTRRGSSVDALASSAASSHSRSSASRLGGRRRCAPRPA